MTRRERVQAEEYIARLELSELQWFDDTTRALLSWNLYGHGGRLHRWRIASWCAEMWGESLDAAERRLRSAREIPLK